MELLKLEWFLIGIGIGITLGEKDLFIFLFGMSILIAGFGLSFYNENERYKKIYEDLDNQHKTKKFIKRDKLKIVTK